MSTVNPYVPPSGSAGGPAAAIPKSGASLDFGRCLGFFFQDPNWVQKLLVGSLFSILSFFLIGGIFVAGYAARLVRRAAKGETYPLPEWDDLGGMFAEGVAVVGAYLIHIVPVVAVFMAGLIPTALLAGDGGEPNPAALMAMLGLFGVGFILMIAVGFYFTSVFTRLALEERFSAAFEVSENFSFLKRNAGNFAMALLAFLTANFLSQFGILLFCVGIIPATFWSQCVGAYAMGEVAFRDAGRR
jgi:hypothetical protein